MRSVTVNTSLKVVGEFDQENEQVIPYFKLKINGEKADRVRKQAMFFPDRERLVIPEWDGGFAIFQAPARGPEIICSSSTDRYQFLETFYLYPTGTVVEIQHGNAVSAPRDRMDEVKTYVYRHMEDFRPLFGDTVDLDRYGQALGALAFRTSGAMHPRKVDPVEALKDLDNKDTFFYLNVSNPDVWDYLENHWVEGNLMIDSGISIPESIKSRLTPIHSEVRIAGSPEEPLAYST